MHGFNSTTCVGSLIASVVHMRYWTIAILIFCSLSAYADESKLDTALKNLSSDQAVDVIVRFKNVPTETQHHRVLAHGGQLRESLDIIRSEHYALPANKLQSLSDDPDVEFIAPDRTVRATGNSAYIGHPDYGWEAVGANLATNVFGLDGTGIGIAVIDSGANNDEDVKNLPGPESLCVPDQSRTKLRSERPHYLATEHNVSGILAGNGHKSKTNNSTYLVRGIAPNANLISIKVLNDTGVGTDSTVQSLESSWRYSSKVDTTSG